MISLFESLAGPPRIIQWHCLYDSQAGCLERYGISSLNPHGVSATFHLDMVKSVPVFFSSSTRPCRFAAKFEQVTDEISFCKMSELSGSKKAAAAPKNAPVLEFIERNGQYWSRRLPHAGKVRAARESFLEIGGRTISLKTMGKRGRIFGRCATLGTATKKPIRALSMHPKSGFTKEPAVENRCPLIPSHRFPLHR